ncbi:hypothetical protein SmphiM6_107 [Sinorhizobium phage phiM6]|nr:hypothetical protein SmphiM6_107 [Sinorhizobium phage phiM6]
MFTIQVFQSTGYMLAVTVGILFVTAVSALAIACIADTFSRRMK